MFSFAAKKILGSAKDSVKDDKSDTAGGVNWKEFNYPPCLTVIHFDPENDAIPALAKKTVIRMKWGWYYAIFILFWNICSNIGFAAAGTDAKVVILYSCLQFIVGTVGGGAVLYQGYRGVAGDLPKSSRIYLGLQSCLTVLMIVFAAVQSGNLHGYQGITSRPDAPQPGYIVLCIIEGTMWLVCSVLSIYNMYRVYRYPGHDRANRLAGTKGGAGGDGEDSINTTGRKSRKGKSKKARAPPADEEV